MINLKKRKAKPVAQVINPSIQEAEANGSLEFKAVLVYVGSSRPPRATKLRLYLRKSDWGGK